MKAEMEAKMIEFNEDLLQLAEMEHPMACFSYAKELYAQLMEGNLRHLGTQKEKAIFEMTYRYLINAKKSGINSAFFYLGMIHLEGIYVERDVEKAFDFYVEGAAKNNAYCFFELSRIYGEGEGHIKPDPYLAFLYLKHAA